MAVLSAVDGVPAIGPNQWRALLASVVVAALGYLAFSLWGGWRDVAAAAARAGAAGAAMLLGLSCLNYAMRFVRWQLYLKALGHPQPWRPSLLIYIAGFALTTTPGKVGEAVRSLFLKTRGVDLAHSGAAFVSERLSDLLAVAILCSFGWNIYPPLRLLIGIGLLLIGVAFLLMLQDRLLMRWQQVVDGRPGRVAATLRLVFRLLRSARRCHQPRILAAATVLSLVAWSAEAFGLHLLLGLLGVDVSPTFSFFTYAISMLAGALSFMPGGLGGTEATMTALLIWRGGSAPIAIAATVFLRLTTLWFAVALGVVALTRLLPTLRPSSGPAAAAVPAKPA